MRRLLLPLLGLLLAGRMLSAQALPAGPGAGVVTARCVVCHGADMIVSQKLSLAGWTNSINKMVRWGAAITPAEREVVQPYLVMHFGPAPAASHANTDAGAATVKRACLVCHDADMIRQQHLSKTGWTKSIEKMMRWGAALTEADKDALAEYLAAQYPPR